MGEQNNTAPETYRVSHGKQSRKFLRKLRNKTVEQRINEAINRLAASRGNPTSIQSKHLKADLHCSYRIWVGKDWRIIYDIVGDELEILKIGHRSDVYQD